jgi:hypothetical protein
MHMTVTAQSSGSGGAAVEAPQAPGAAKAPTAPSAPGSPDAPPAVPRDGGQITITDGEHGKTVTIQQVPPQLMPLAQMAQETALGLMGLLAAIFILGPFARMIARRMERRPELRAVEQRDHLIQQQMHQLEQLQQSIDAMSVEVERISESQRFQSKLMLEKKELLS